MRADAAPAVRHEGRVYGTTVSSLTTVSRTPLPLAASLRKGCDLAHLAVAEGRFADEGLAAGGSPFDGSAWRSAPYSGAPLLDGALAHHGCRASGTFSVGDHEVLPGLVVRADGGPGGMPLLAHNGELCAGGPDAAHVPDSAATRPNATRPNVTHPKEKEGAAL
ncbi:flavin reductase [Streptomyces sp. S6]